MDERSILACFPRTPAAAGAASTLSFTYCQPVLKRAGCFDALGVFSLHMVPGLMGGIISAIAASCIDTPAWSIEAIMHDVSRRSRPRTSAPRRRRRLYCPHCSESSPLTHRRRVPCEPPATLPKLPRSFRAAWSGAPLSSSAATRCASCPLRLSTPRNLRLLL